MGNHSIYREFYTRLKTLICLWIKNTILNHAAHYIKVNRNETKTVLPFTLMFQT